MTFPVTDTQAQTVYNDARSFGSLVLNRGPAWKATANASHDASFLINDLLPKVRQALEQQFRPSSAYTQPFKDAVEAYAGTQLESPPVDWWAEYDAVRAEIIKVRNRAVAEVPAEWGSVDASGTVTWATIAANASLANGIQDLIEAFS